MLAAAAAFQNKVTMTKNRLQAKAEADVVQKVKSRGLASLTVSDISIILEEVTLATGMV